MAGAGRRRGGGWAGASRAGARAPLGEAPALGTALATGGLGCWRPAWDRRGAGLQVSRAQGPPESPLGPGLPKLAPAIAVRKGARLRPSLITAVSVRRQEPPGPAAAPVLCMRPLDATRASPRSTPPAAPYCQCALRRLHGHRSTLETARLCVVKRWRDGCLDNVKLQRREGLLVLEPHVLVSAPELLERACH